MDAAAAMAGIRLPARKIRSGGGIFAERSRLDEVWEAYPACRSRGGFIVASVTDGFTTLAGNARRKKDAPMSKLRVAGFGISIDGFGAGAGQTLTNPMGVGGMALHEWVLGTKTFRQMHDFAESLSSGQPPREDVDDRFAARAFENVGAWILGRNMFGPIRGEWPDDEWKGWWGENPPYHVPVFVLTHHARSPLVMAGGTTFHFVTEGIHAALDRAKEAAQGKDVRLGGGVATIREYLSERLIDELHLAVSPVVLGQGENLFGGIDTAQLGYRCTERAFSERAMHVVLTR